MAKTNRTTPKDQFDRFDFVTQKLECSTLPANGSAPDRREYWNLFVLDRQAVPVDGDYLLTEGGCWIVPYGAKYPPYVVRAGVLVSCGFILFERFPAGLDRQTCIDLMPHLKPIAEAMCPARLKRPRRRFNKP